MLELFATYASIFSAKVIMTSNVCVEFSLKKIVENVIPSTGPSPRLPALLLPTATLLPTTSAVASIKSLPQPPEEEEEGVQM